MTIAYPYRTVYAQKFFEKGKRKGSVSSRGGGFGFFSHTILTFGRSPIFSHTNFNLDGDPDPIKPLPGYAPDTVDLKIHFRFTSPSTESTPVTTS